MASKAALPLSLLGATSSSSVAGGEERAAIMKEADDTYASLIESLLFRIAD